jgi:hypothetical protein
MTEGLIFWKPKEALLQSAMKEATLELKGIRLHDIEVEI